MFLVAVGLFLLIWIGAYKGKHIIKSILWVIFIFLLTGIFMALGIVPIF